MNRDRIMKALRTHKNWLMPLAALIVVGGAAFGISMVADASHPQDTLAAAAVVATTTVPAPNAFEGLDLQGHAAIVYDLTNGQTLYSNNADAQLPLASLTKLITMSAASKTLQTTSPVIITQTALDQDGDSGFTLGETFAFKDLARLTLVDSSNDGAEAIAEATAARQSVSIPQMLSSAISSLGLSHTTAVNGTGLDVSLTQAGAYGSAHDVAILASTLLKDDPSIASATVEPSFTIYSDQGIAHTLPNTNQDVVNIPGIMFSKTGYTDLAGGNLAVIFDAGINHPVAVVILGSTFDGRFTDVQHLIRATQAHFAGLAQ